MKLTCIRLEAFRQFRAPIEIAGLAEGINLFTGPNETGKSTLAQAVRAAFFERHRSGSVEHLRPWGDTSATPTVELEFTFGGKHYRLTKAFLGKKRCALTVDGKPMDGTEAEDHLAELFGFRYAGKGASQAECWGIPGLLWMEQGGAQELTEPVEHASAYLQKALGKSVGELASSDGDRVLAEVERLRNELLTPAAGAPRGAFTEAIAQRNKLKEELDTVSSGVAEYRSAVDRFAELKQEHARDEHGKPWEGLRASARRAQGELDAVDELERTQQQENVALKAATAQVALLVERLSNFRKQEQDRTEFRGKVDTAKSTVQRALQEVAIREAAVTSAKTTLQSAQDLRRLVLQEAARREALRRSETAASQLRSLTDVLDKVEAQERNLATLRTAAEALSLPADVLNLLRKQQGELDGLHAKLSAVATRLRFKLNDGQRLQIGKEQVSGAGEVLLVEPTTIVLPGMGVLEVAPGESDASELSGQIVSLQSSHQALLQQWGVRSLAAAEARALEYATQQIRIREAEAMLTALVPKGLDLLRTEKANASGEAQQSADALAQFPPPPVNAESLPTPAEAENAEESARGQVTRLESELTSARMAHSGASASVGELERQLLALEGLVSAPDRAAAIEQANADLVSANAAKNVLASGIEARAAKISEARPEVLQQDVERFQKSADELSRRFGARHEELLRLGTDLKVKGALGLEERRAELERDQEQLGRRVVELERRSRALDYLLKLLQAKRAEVTKRLHAPLQLRMNHYLGILMPGAQLTLREDLSPESLVRKTGQGQQSGELEEMSFGCREQLGVISRFAYADLLLNAGRPTMLILDDALVHSDEERLRQMKRVLFDAATRHQVLLFTCHPEKWTDLGVAARSLAELRSTKASDVMAVA